MVAKKTKKKKKDSLVKKALDLLIGDKPKKEGSGFRNANKQLDKLDK